MNRACARTCAGFVAGVLTVSAAGCTRERGSQTDYFPLHSDDTWVYEVAQPLRNVRTRMTVRVRDERYLQTVGRRCRLVDESYSALNDPLSAPTTASGKAEVYPIAYCREKGFLYRAMSLEYRGNELREIGLGSNEDRFLPDGLGGNLAWDSTTTAYELGGGNGYGVRQTHRAAPEPNVVQVPAGRFSGCVRVDTVALHSGRRNANYDSDPVVLYYADWYAPNVGLVRTIQSDRPDGKPPLAQIDLLAYDVEGAR